MNENDEENTEAPANSSKLLSGQSLLHVHTNTGKILPKDGLKDFNPTNSWMEKKQIQSALDERKELLDEERVEKWGCLAGAIWDQKKKLAEVTRRTGKHFQTLGFEKEGTLFLYPEEALYLLETNSLELTFGGVPMSIQQAYSLLLGPNSGCGLIEYRTYSHLLRQGYKLLRFTSQKVHTKYERSIKLDQHTRIKRNHPGQKERGTKDCNIGNVLDKVPNEALIKQEKKKAQGGGEEAGSIVVGQQSKEKTVIVKKEEKDQHSSSVHEATIQTLDSPLQGNQATVKSEEEYGKSGSSDNSLSNTTAEKEEKNMETCQSVSAINTADGKDTTEQEPETSTEKSAPSNTNDSRNGAGNILEDIMQQETEPSTETMITSENTNTSSVEIAKTKAYGIAESLLTLGSTLVGKEANPDNGNDSAITVEKNLSATLQSEIVKMLGTHMENNISEEALAAVASSAASTILSHMKSGMDSDASIQDAVSHQEMTEDGNTASLSDCEQDPEEGSISEPLQNNHVDITDEEDTRSLNQDSEASLICCNEAEGIQSPKVLKRPASPSSEQGECEPVMIKRSKKAEGSDSEIEVIDVVPEKKEVEFVNLSDESSINSSDDDDVNDERNREIEVIDLQDTSSSESSSTDSSSSGTDSSIMVEEGRDVRQGTVNWTQERKRILDTFPDMFNRSVMSVVPPSSDLLPSNVQPQRSHYVLSRKGLQSESRENISRPTCSEFPPLNQHNSFSFDTQGTPPQPVWQPNIPINPIAAVQAIAQLVLPMLGLPPDQMWMPNSPCPPWIRAPFFNQRPPRGNHWRSRSRRGYFRHFTPRYPRQHRGSNYRYQHSFNRRSNLKVMSGSEVGVFSGNNVVTPLQSTSHNNVEEITDEVQRSQDSDPSTEWHPWNKLKQKVGGKKREKRKQRYYVEPLRFAGKCSLTEENCEVISLHSDGSSTNKSTNIKPESDYSDESLEGMDFSHSNEHSAQEESESTDGSCNSPTEVKPLLSPEDCTSYASVFKTIQVIKEVDTRSLISNVHANRLKPHFEMFSPSKPFRKGNPPVPDFHLCIMRFDDDVPTPGELKALSESLDDAVPIMFAIVSPESISFIQLCDMSLPCISMSN